MFAQVLPAIAAIFTTIAPDLPAFVTSGDMPVSAPVFADLTSDLPSISPVVAIDAAIARIFHAFAGQTTLFERRCADRRQQGGGEQTESDESECH